jgi:hypothetical protein
MQDVARQAIREYIENHSRSELLDQVLDEELPRRADSWAGLHGARLWLARSGGGATASHPVREGCLNDRRLTLTNDAAYDLVMDVAAGDLDSVEEVAAVLRQATRPAR